MENVNIKIGTRKMVIAGMLGAVTIVLGATGLGFIPIPNLAGRATIMHIPVILAAILEGPVVGAFTGFIFGLYSFLTPTGAIPADPIVRILPRILIGVFSYYAFWAFRWNTTLASAIAAAVGTLTNTIGFLGLAVLIGYFPLEMAYVIIINNTIFEVLLAIVITVALVRALKKYREKF
ncbi:MAG: ECF transporter S component [Clostridia bacterium]|nr:ECF transporter S component [Clostridia bacterium]